MTYYPFMKKMADMFNLTTLNFSSLDLLYDALVVSEYLGRPKPVNLSDSDYSNLKHIENWYDIFRLNYDLAKAYNTNTTEGGINVPSVPLAARMPADCLGE